MGQFRANTQRLGQEKWGEVKQLPHAVLLFDVCWEEDLSILSCRRAKMSRWRPSLAPCSLLAVTAFCVRAF